MGMPEHLAKQLETAEDIYNVLCLVYNEATSAEFYVAVERLLREQFVSEVIDQDELRKLQSDADERSRFKDELFRLTQKLRDLAYDFEP